MTFLVAACSHTAPDIKSASSVQVVSDVGAFVFPPPGGPAIMGVRERSYANGREQIITLGNSSTIPGENTIRVRLYGELAERTAELPKMSRASLSETNLTGEVRAAVPGIRMDKAAYYVQNRYGPFGYAMGRRGSDLCMYAWQQLRSKATVFGRKGSIDLRTRVCQKSASEHELLSFVYGYTINAFIDDPTWNPYGVSNPNRAVEGNGSEIYPIGASKFEIVTSPPPVKPRKQPTKRRVIRKTEQLQPADLQQPSGPIIPAPMGQAPLGNDAAVPEIPRPVN